MSTLDKLTIVICSNRPENIHKYFLRCLVDKLTCECLVILDCPMSSATEEAVELLRTRGVTAILNGKNQGLSYCRNLAVERCKSDYILFIDDDITFAHDVPERIESELDKGADIVGVAIFLPEHLTKLPWYISDGQLHYLGAHKLNLMHATTWGACMAFNRKKFSAQLTKFRSDLGRRGKGLESGDDTTLIRELKRQGAIEKFIADYHVTHHVDVKRLTLRYMLRRAYWQGRSEFRRKQVLQGLKKEYQRFLAAENQLILRYVLAWLYIGVISYGIVIEAMLHRITFAQQFLSEAPSSESRIIDKIQ